MFSGEARIQSLEIEFYCGQRLTNLIMKLTGQTTTLRFLRLKKLPCEPLRPFATGSNLIQ